MGFDVNFKETKVPEYILPDPLICLDGTEVTEKILWFQKRRREIFDLFEHQMYGKMPGKPEKMSFKIKSIDKDALKGKATRKEISVVLENNHSELQLDILIYLPNFQPKPVANFIALNFIGN